MRKLYLLMTGLCLALGAAAQTDTPSSPTGKTDTSFHPAGNTDTIRIGNLVIIKKGGGGYERSEDIRITRRRGKNENVSTNWGIVDLGFANFTDNTNYAGAAAQQLAPGGKENWFKLRNGKSVDINIWIFMQRLNMIKHVVNLKYGLGLELNNYRYEEPVRYNKAAGQFTMDLTNHYKKNKLATDYITVPLMLNFNFTPQNDNNKTFGLSAGVSAGYLYSSRQKTITSEEGKKKTRDDFSLRPFKISYIAELQLGPVKLFGSLASQSMFKKGLDQTPYNFGLRLSNW
jgi:hypothetical protein